MATHMPTEIANKQHTNTKRGKPPVAEVGMLLPIHVHIYLVTNSTI